MHTTVMVGITHQNCVTWWALPTYLLSHLEFYQVGLTFGKHYRPLPTKFFTVHAGPNPKKHVKKMMEEIFLFRIYSQVTAPCSPIHHHRKAIRMLELGRKPSKFLINTCTYSSINT